MRSRWRLVASIVVVVSAAVYRCTPLWPGPALPAGATRLAIVTEPAHLLPASGCPAALLGPGRIEHEGARLVWRMVESGEAVDVVWPAGWAAWHVGDRAELATREGEVVAREGEVVAGFGGGFLNDGAFHVCDHGW